MKIEKAVQFVSKFAARASEKDAPESERVVIQWMPTGLLLAHLNIVPAPKIRRFAKLQFDSATTEQEKRNAIAQFFSPFGKRLPLAVLCWSDGMTFRQLTLPGMPAEDLVKAIDWDLKKKYYFDSQASLWDYKEVATLESEEGPEKLYSIFYCENTTALPRLDQALSLGLTVSALVPGPAALAKFASADDPPPGKDVLLCELQGENVRLIAARDGQAMLMRNIPATSDWNDEALSRLADEVRKTLDFYETQKYARAVGKIVFTGERCEPMRVLDFMTGKFPGTPVGISGIEQFLSPDLDAADRDSALSSGPAFAAILGAALASDDTLNLVPAEIKTKNQLGKINRLLNLGIFVFAGLLLLVLGLTSLNLNWTKSQIGGLMQEFVKLNENKKVLQDMLTRSRVRRTTLNGDVPMHALMKELSLRTPGSIMLSQLQFNRGDSTLAIKGEVTDVKREGMKTLTQFTTSLAESSFFSSATITNSVQDDAQKTLIFELTVVTKGLSI